MPFWLLFPLTYSSLFFWFEKLRAAWRACTKLTHTPHHHIRMKTFFRVCIIAAHIKRRDENEFSSFRREQKKTAKIPTLFLECPNFDLFDCSTCFYTVFNAFMPLHVSNSRSWNMWSGSVFKSIFLWYIMQTFGRKRSCVLIFTSMLRHHITHAWLWFIDCGTFSIFDGAEYSIINGIHFFCGQIAPIVDYCWQFFIQSMWFCPVRFLQHLTKYHLPFSWKNSQYSMHIQCFNAISSGI